MALVAAMIRLARRDLTNPNHSVQARAFLRGRPFAGRSVGIDLDLFGRLVGYTGSWEV